MQSVMFNSQHIPVSKDTLHSHKILTSSLETKILTMHSRKDQKNEITHECTSRAAVYLLDPLISCCFSTASTFHRQSMTSTEVKRTNAHNIMVIQAHSPTNTHSLLGVWHWQSYRTSDNKQHRFPLTTATLLVQITCTLKIMTAVWPLVVIVENIILVI